MAILSQVGMFTAFTGGDHPPDPHNKEMTRSNSINMSEIPAKCVFRTPAWKSVLLENLKGKGVLNLNAQKAPAESSLAPT